jgi:hypothetical protein
VKEFCKKLRTCAHAGAGAGKRCARRRSAGHPPTGARRRVGNEAVDRRRICGVGAALPAAGPAGGSRRIAQRDGDLPPRRGRGARRHRPLRTDDAERVLAALSSLAAIAVSNDSGPIHFAVALGRPTAEADELAIAAARMAEGGRAQPSPTLRVALDRGYR